MKDTKKGFDVLGMLKEDKTIGELTNDELADIYAYSEVTNPFFYLIHDEISKRLKGDFS